ncbi:toprim domain-containing protein [Thalassobius sp. Cn5-15]|uniref:DUF7146 domain-containing protein n=1 Tax=Thalassobius sp. Cn5-15 TaxID=2917763 RepID=UPI001EF1FA9F|nr:toprim domain-containing protein [Thalassobius sp. Cn5-15]MCG7492452.1 toprim domain-containing protein [Thalassobius sp. Cn5-15]
MNTRTSTAELAQGKWVAILQAAGVPSQFLKNKHGPCPGCGGENRYRFDNKEGRGTWICSRCQSGDGLDLLQGYFGWDFKTAAQKVDEIIGNNPDLKSEAPKGGTNKESAERWRRELWQQSEPFDPSRHAHIRDYLTKRGCYDPDMLGDVRYAPSARVRDGLWLPAMVLAVRGSTGSVVQLHRTFLDPNSPIKAEIEAPRAMMPGAVPEGAAVWTSAPAETMGIAEGFETALAASLMHGIPVWSAIDAGKLEKFTPPEGVKHLVIFGDNDRSFTGQKAAYALAWRISRKGEVKVDVEIPAETGDWNDVRLSRLLHS